MNIRYSGKNIVVTEGMKKHLNQKIAKFEKYAPRLVESHVILVKQKYLLVAEITLLAKNFKAYGEGTSKENIFAAIDIAYTKVEKQLKRFREKVKDHHKRNSSGSTLSAREKAARKISFASAAVENDLPRIVRMSTFAVKPMSAEEASLQLKLSPQPYLVFQNATTQQVNVIIKREDGNHGLIEPGFKEQRR